MNAVTVFNQHSFMTRVLFFMVSIVALALFSCSNDSSVEDIVGDSGPPGPTNSLYVSPSAGGTGSSQDPFSTIQQAIDSASVDSSITHILVSTGDYSESLEIGSPIVIIGSLDPTDKWSSSNSGWTTINGKQIEGHAIAVSVRDINGAVVLERLQIHGSDAVDSGASSYGVYCSKVTSVRVVNCRVKAGNGMVGKNGIRGLDGMPGDDAFLRTSFEPIGAGQLATPGGVGGEGQNVLGNPATPGQQGFCADSSQTGGIGGSAGRRAGSNGDPGANGGSGQGGISELSVSIDSDYLLVDSDSGRTGQGGSLGCGGGGGGGSGVTFGHTGPESGGDGGGGGGGGFGGEGGRGGKGGGSSIGIFVHGGSLTANNSSIATSRGGIGGNGKPGGTGGQGGRGVRGFNCCGFPGGPGGDGGSGGRGGHGGGGAGGWSIGILTYQAQFDSDIATWFQLGMVAGGGSGGDFPAPRGESGQRVKVWSIQ